jgi:hypothetical protein
MTGCGAKVVLCRCRTLRTNAPVASRHRSCLTAIFPAEENQFNKIDR